jgi:putative flippase GtrA
MKQLIVQREVDEILEGSEAIDVRRVSYQKTPWPLVNSILDVVDRITHGHAALAQRLFLFVCVGGFAACTNLLFFYVLSNFVPLPVSNMVQNAFAFLIATEISIMANFIPNDLLTFRNMAGGRSWIARCIRFHMTCILGAILTYIIQFCLYFSLHIPAFFAQAVALILVLFYNFTFHHLFTYRHKDEAGGKALQLKNEAELVKHMLAEKLELNDDDTLKLVVTNASSGC